MLVAAPRAAGKCPACEDAIPRVPHGSAARPLRVLVLSSLYPTSINPRHGVFVETRLRELLALGGIEARVISPVPWFFSRSPLFGRYAQHAATPAAEVRSGVAITRPRYLMLPRIGMRLQPAAVARAALGAARRLQDSGFDCDLVDAHYLYPDGVAAAVVAGALGKPFIMTARGSDLNVIAGAPAARAAMVAAAQRAARVICVSAALRDRAAAIGIPPSSLEVLRNGVDTTLFAPRDRAAARRAQDVSANVDPLLLAVGNLVSDKAFTLAVDALAAFPRGLLLIVGDGPERSRLQQHAASLGVEARVRFHPAVPQSALPGIYSAADVLLLTSRNEGWPNVVLEAMACGTPVVACNVGGVPEILGGSTAGRIVGERTGSALAGAVRDVLTPALAIADVRAHALRFGWRPVVTRYRELMLEAVEANAR